VGKAGKYFIGQQRSLGALNGYVEEVITGQKVVKVFNHEEACQEEFDQLNEELCHNAYTAGKLANLMGPLNNNLGYVQYAILAVVGGILVVSSDGSLLTLGNLMTFMLLSRTFNMPISQISNQINAIVMALAGAERIFEIMDTPDEIDEGTLDVEVSRIQGNIEFENIQFGYVPEEPVLKGLNLSVKKGQRIAIVGATGSGTLMWDISDTLNGMMAIPNLISLLLMSSVIANITTEYFKDKK
jgi:ATP-binding cassette subfamily B protein